MRRPSLSILVLVACLSGCSKHATDTTGPPPPPVPELVATQPPARSPSALYDSDIWAQFDRPLDARTVTTQNVYLKLDAQRIPITVSYDALTQRVSLKPTPILELQRTYTVEFSTALKGTDGTALAPGVFFQFTTNSLRRPVYDFPLRGALEGPVTTLCWGGTQGPTNNIFYELYVSPDSAAVEARTAPMLMRHVFTRFVPDVGWPMGTTMYWAITTENLTTHERLAGGVRSFRTLDPNTPPYQAEELRWGAPNSTHLIVENAGHEQTFWQNVTAAPVIADFLAGKDVSDRKITYPPLRFVPLEGTDPKATHPSVTR